ncbi:MAG: CHAD domain-containing protein [Acidobacteriia bacterium]|nr:CHAD domain-containing protein [Terriglobia bacterium]
MMQQYARERASTLLRRLAFRMNRAARFRDADSIHDLRVAIRRFEQCLQIFHQFFPGHTKKIHRRLGRIMELSGEIRNRDIALDLMKQAGVKANSALPTQLLRERKEIQGKLMASFDRWGERDLSRKWGSRLGL